MSLWKFGEQVEVDQTPSAPSTGGGYSLGESVSLPESAGASLSPDMASAIEHAVSAAPGRIHQLTEALPPAGEYGFLKKAAPVAIPLALGAATGAMLPAAVAPGLDLATKAGRLIHGLISGVGFATGERAGRRITAPSHISSTSADEETFQKEESEKSAADNKSFLLNTLVPFLGEAGAQVIHTLPVGKLSLLGKTVKSIVGGGGGAWLADYLSGKATGVPSSGIETLGTVMGGAIGQPISDASRGLMTGPDMRDPVVQTAIKYGHLQPVVPIKDEVGMFRIMDDAVGAPKFTPTPPPQPRPAVTEEVSGVLLQDPNSSRRQALRALVGVASPEADEALAKGIRIPAQTLETEFPRQPEATVSGAARTLQTTAEGVGQADIRQRTFTPPGESTPISPANRAVRTILPEVPELPNGEEWVRAATGATKKSEEYMGKLVNQIDPYLKPDATGTGAGPQNILDNAYKTTGRQYGALQKTMANMAGKEPIPVPKFEQAVLDFNKYVTDLGLPGTDALAKESEKYIKELTERTFTANELLEKVKRLKAIRDSMYASGSRLDKDGAKLYRDMVHAIDSDVSDAVRANPTMTDEASQAIIGKFRELSGKYRVFSAAKDAIEDAMLGERITPKIQKTVESALPELGAPGQGLLGVAAEAARSPEILLPKQIMKAEAAGGMLKLAQSGDKGFWRRVASDKTGDTETRLIYEILDKVTAADGTLNGKAVMKWMTLKENRAIMSNLSKNGKAALAAVAADPALIKSGIVDGQIRFGKTLAAAPNKRAALTKLMSEEGGISPEALDNILLNDKNGEFRKLVGDIVTAENIRNPTTGQVDPKRFINYLNVTEPERLAAYTSPEAIQVMSELKPLMERYGDAIKDWPKEAVARLSNRVRGLTSIMGTGSSTAAGMGVQAGPGRVAAELLALAALVHAPQMVQKLIIRNWTPAQISRAMGMGRALSDVIGVKGPQELFGKKKEGTTKYDTR